MWESCCLHAFDTPWKNTYISSNVLFLLTGDEDRVERIEAFLCISLKCVGLFQQRKRKTNMTLQEMLLITILMSSQWIVRNLLFTCKIIISLHIGRVPDIMDDIHSALSEINYRFEIQTWREGELFNYWFVSEEKDLVLVYFFLGRSYIFWVKVIYNMS